MHTIRSYAHISQGFHEAYARAVFFILAGLCLSLMLIYGYFLKSAAFAAAMWENDQATLATLSSEVSDMESRYFSRIQGLDMNEANRLGLSETRNTLFIARGSGTRLTFAEGGARARSGQ